MAGDYVARENGRVCVGEASKQMAYDFDETKEKTPWDENPTRRWALIFSVFLIPLFLLADV